MVNDVASQIQRLEERVVHPAASEIRRSLIHGLWIFEEVQYRGQQFGSLLHDAAAGLAIFFELNAFNSQLLKSFTEFACRHRSFSHGIDEAFLLLLQLAKSLHCVVSATDDIASIELERLLCLLAYGAGEALWHLDSRVESNNCRLNAVRRQVGKVADTKLPSTTDEVAVHAAVAC